MILNWEIYFYLYFYLYFSLQLHHSRVKRSLPSRLSLSLNATCWANIFHPHLPVISGQRRKGSVISAVLCGQDPLVLVPGAAVLTSRAEKNRLYRTQRVSEQQCELEFIIEEKINGKRSSTDIISWKPEPNGLIRRSR
ncbi:hypothetical protein XENTR_v10017441 [Xenopus tropicalis]|nr:hypothetical protein XENTR_v10017441 [Xenopus tropicalis]